MKTINTVLSYVSGFGLIIAITTRIIFVAGGSNICNDIASICLVLAAIAYIIRVMIALITDETSQRLLSAVAVFALLFICDYAMSQLLPGIWGSNKERWSRVIGSFLFIFVGFGGMVKIVYNLYTPFEDKNRQARKNQIN